MLKTTNRRLVKILLIVGVFLIIGLLVVQFRAEQMVTKFLESKIPTHLIVDYGDLTVNVFTGTVNFEELTVALANRDSSLTHTEIRSKGLKVMGVQYWQFFLNNTLEARMISLESPEMVYYQNRKLPRKDTTSQGVVNLLRTIVVDEIAINDGSFQMYGESEDSVQLSVGHVNFTLSQAKTDPQIIKRKMPIEYGDYTFLADHVFVDLGRFEKLNVDNLLVENRTISITELQLRSKYNRRELSKVAKFERDHISLYIPKIEITDLDFGFEKDRFFVSTTALNVGSPDLEIYRDKLLPDEHSPKILYSKMLRELPINIEIPEITMDNGKVTYEELAESNTAPGKLNLSNISGIITNINNSAQKNDLAKVDIKADFMDGAKVNLNYDFNVNDTHDSFTASGSIFNFKSAGANSFLRPNLHAQAEGFIDQLYFTISGDSKSSRGDMKMKYHDFKFKVFDKNLTKVNKLLTAIGNIFVNDGSKTDNEGFRHGKIEVVRDPNKSFFNYLWLNIKSGILSTITGKAVKKD